MAITIQFIDGETSIAPGWYWWAGIPGTLAATLEGEVRGIRSTINILIAAEKERLDEIEDLKKIVNSRAQGAKL